MHYYSSTDPSPTEDLVKALGVQYQHVEEYCQVQTQLSNLLVTRNHKRVMRSRPATAAAGSVYMYHQHELQAVQAVDQATEHVRDDLVALRTLSDLYSTTDTGTCIVPEHLQALLKQHLALSQRVLRSVREPFHSNGVPNVTAAATRAQLKHNTGNNEVQMVALAALRASVARIAEAAK